MRDRIPEIIQNSGKRCAIETMPEMEYRQALLEKLLEEVQEARHAQPEELITELADLQEVIAAVLDVWQISSELVQQLQRQRHVERLDEIAYKHGIRNYPELSGIYQHIARRPSLPHLL